MKVVSGGYGMPDKGSTAVRCQVPGGMATVSNLTGCSGEVNTGNFVETDSK